MFKIENVTKKFKTEEALRDVSFEIHSGMNFIIGSSGSGKTSLLKIISGLDINFEGDVLYYARSLKDIPIKEKSNLYNQKFGFIWQDFNLLEDATVEENILLPTYINDKERVKQSKSILKNLSITNIKNQKVNTLSGGQKQRVAIARELMKNPEVIFCDEPTSALDIKSASSTMDILRRLSKSKTVIMVTHDTSLINDKDTVFELDKGELVEQENVRKNNVKKYKSLEKSSFSLTSSFKLAFMNLKNKIGMSMISLLAIVLSSVLMLTITSGMIGNSGKNEFDQLLNTYGDSLLDLHLVGSFSNASGTSDNDKGPAGNVDQDLSGIYEKYATDERTSYIIPSLFYENISITMDNKKYNIESSGSAPQLTKLISGKLPDNESFEVVVPKQYVKDSGESNDSILGKTITFKGEVREWVGNTANYNPIRIEAKVSGVADNSLTSELEGEVFEYSIDDSFFFGKSAIQEIRQQGKTEDEQMSFVIRAKSLEDLLSLKDELNKSGIIPIGAFELIEDIASLNNQTQKQSGASNAVLILLAIIIAGATALMSSILRKKEFAIFKVTGFNNQQVSLIYIFEMLITYFVAVVFIIISYPLLNMATNLIFKTAIVGSKSIVMVPLMALLVIGVMLIVSLPIVYRVPTDFLVKGDTAND